MKPAIQSRVHQQGIVLVIALIMLLLLTLVGTAAMQSTSLEEKMAGNANNRKMSFEAAETSLRDGENWIENVQLPKPVPVSECSSGCEDTVYVMQSLSPTAASIWSADSTQTRSYSGSLPGTAAPKHYIEYDRFLKDTLNVGTQGDNEGRDYYSVTARGTGGNDTAASLLRSSYARRY